MPAKKRSILFVGSSEMGHECCRALLEAGYSISGILTNPKQFSISYAKDGVSNVMHRDFSDLAREHRVPIRVMGGKMSDPDVMQFVTEVAPDLILVIGWYHMIPKRLRDIAPLGVVGIHNSLLPKYRGGAPLVWAMINGEPSTGTSLFYLGDGVDTGDLLAQRKFPIQPSDTIREVVKKAELAGLDMLLETTPGILAGTASSTPQDHGQATQYPQRSPSDGLIDWSWDAIRLRNFIRAQTRPYPGAYTIVAGKKVVIWDADVVEAAP
jgi:methionyl-tRNA formyltransferase